MVAYYNEIDPGAAAWLRVLISEGHIADGDVDERSIEDVCPNDLRPYTQCHFFAGIGVWSYALRLAGWPDDRHVWTGSCPCQPFSNAGKGGGFADERHLWPAFYHLICQCEPLEIFGEQVESTAGRKWLDLVFADMEAKSYAIGAFNLPAASTGAYHIRQRHWFVAHAEAERCRSRRDLRAQFQGDRGRIEQSGRSGSSGLLADTGRQRLEEQRLPLGPVGGAHPEASRRREAGLLADTGLSGSPARQQAELQRTYWPLDRGATEQFGRPSRTADWILCRDDKWRPIEPGTFPLSHGSPARVGLLRGYGNAIDAETAAEFIRAYSDIRPSCFDVVGN